MKMQSLSSGVAPMLRSRKGNIRRTARVRWLGDKVKETRRRRDRHDGEGGTVYVQKGGASRQEAKTKEKRHEGPSNEV